MIAVGSLLTHTATDMGRVIKFILPV